MENYFGFCPTHRTTAPGPPVDQWATKIALLLSSTLLHAQTAPHHGRTAWMEPGLHSHMNVCCCSVAQSSGWLAVPGVYRSTQFQGHVAAQSCVYAIWAGGMQGARAVQQYEDLTEHGSQCWTTLVVYCCLARAIHCHMPLAPHRHKPPGSTLHECGCMQPHASRPMLLPGLDQHCCPNAAPWVWQGPLGEFDTFVLNHLLSSEIMCQSLESTNQLTSHTLPTCQGEFTKFIISLIFSNRAPFACEAQIAVL